MFNGAAPAGGLEVAHIPLVLARALWLCALMSATGALLFRALEGERLAAVGRPLSRLIAASLGAAGAGWALWTLLQTAAIAGTGGVADTLAALAPVFSRTLFGHVALAQMALLLLAGVAIRRRWLPAACALGATMLQAGHLHAWAMGGADSVLTWSVVLHLVAAAGWLGALAPLWLAVGAVPLPLAADVVRRFSARASVLVAVLAATALVQAFQMIGGVGGLFGTWYGWVALTKAVLLAALLALACRHRFVLTPALAEPWARTALRRGIALETGLGIAVLLAASVLTALPPGMHGEPIWPFTVRPRLPPTAADGAVLAALAAAIFLAAAAIFRRRRGVALTLVAGVALLAAGRLGGMMEAATPTSFFRSPTGFTAASVAEGGTLFAARCAGCHENPLLASADGDLFWRLGTHPSSGLDDDQRWQVIDVLRARAAAGSPQARAPDVQLACADGSAPALSELRGQAVRLTFRPAPAADEAQMAGKSCRIDDPDARTAEAIAAGVSPEALVGMTMLIDPNGFLRGMVRADTVQSALATGP